MLYFPAKDFWVFSKPGPSMGEYWLCKCHSSRTCWWKESYPSRSPWEAVLVDTLPPETGDSGAQTTVHTWPGDGRPARHVEVLAAVSVHWSQFGRSGGWPCSETFKDCLPTISCLCSLSILSPLDCPSPCLLALSVPHHTRAQCSVRASPRE